VRRDLPRGTVTFLFTDIEGSTKLLRDLGDRYADVLADHRRALREAFTRHGGVEVDLQGDAFFVAFERASDAVAAAAEAQSAIRGGAVRARMGLHSGEPMVTEEGYVGIDVHRASRIAAVAHGGQVLVSQTTRDLVDTEVRDLGDHQLWDLEAPERLYQLGLADFPPLRTLRRSNLPAQPNSFIGRDRELGEVIRFVRGGTRLLTLTGPGGSGKTRLALEAAASLTDDFADGVWFVPLAPVVDPALVEPTIEEALGIRRPRDALRSTRLLLLLDNLEHLLDAAPRIAELVATAPAISVLATSRERLALAAEQEYVVPMLPHEDAAALFTDRARRIRPSFQPDADVTEIARRLDGLPLAVELAAAQVKVLTPAEIRDRLGRGLDVLTAGTRDAPERQRTLRATVEWSYDLLGPNLQDLFARLAVFSGSFDLLAAEAVTDADVHELGALVDKSLLWRTDEGRFFMLATIRELAAERLAERHDAESTHDRHALHFLALAERPRPPAPLTAGAAEIERFAVEHDNFRGALAWLRLHPDAELQLRLATALTFLWRARGHAPEGRRWLDEGLARGDVSRPLRSAALSWTATFARRQGDYRGAEEYARERCTLHADDESPAAAEALIDLGSVLAELNDSRRARELLTEGRARAEAAGDQRVLYRALANLGYLDTFEGAYAPAQEELERALELARDLASPPPVAWALTLLGTCARRRGRDDEARTALAESLRLWRDVGSQEGAADSLEQVAALLVAGGRSEDAATLVGAADELRRTAGLVVPPVEADEHRALRNEIRSALGAERARAAAEAGAAMTLGEAVELALANVD
jgi:predicted ATPase